MLDYTIRALFKKSDMDLLEDLQHAVWGYAGGSGAPLPYSSRCLFEFAESGGLVAGAVSEADSEIIGFCASWLGRERCGRKQLYLHSQLLGVKESWRDVGVGTALKLYQRQFAMSLELRLIKWTFDPLQPRNAFMNLAKLGGVVRSFIPDYYGNLGGKQNMALATDRFWTEWYLDSPRVECKLNKCSSCAYSTAIPVVNLVEGPDMERRCVSWNRNIKSRFLLIEVPMNMPSLRSLNPALALEWQSISREMFTHFLPSYIIVDCFRENARIFYVLNQSSLEEVLDNSSPTHPVTDECHIR
jgi:predicted GNAT superfamily acetyltransferase